MGLIEKRTLVAKLSPPLDQFLTEQLVEEFVSIEQRYILRDWEPAELDGGQFCEVLGRILYHQDASNLDRGRDFGDCQKFIFNDAVSHVLDRDDAKMLFLVANVVHKFRSKRGAVHISPKYQANHMDSKYMVEAVRWLMAETLRLFWNGDRDAVALAISEVLRFDVPAVGKFDDIVLVQRTDLKAEEEVLVLLHYAGEGGLSRRELGRFAHCSAPAVTTAINELVSPQKRQAVRLGNDRIILTDLGQKRIREQLADKLLLE